MNELRGKRIEEIPTSELQSLHDQLIGELETIEEEMERRNERL